MRFSFLSRGLQHVHGGHGGVFLQHIKFLESHGFPPGAFADCRGLDARGLPKFRVRAGRREVF